jgi:hypothetical protein
MRSRWSGRRPSPALIVAAVAMCLALVGTAIAGQVNLRTGKIKPLSIGKGKLKNDTLTGKKIKESTLGTVPRAEKASSADSAANTSLVAGLTLRKVSFRADAGSVETNILDIRGFDIAATCDGGGDLVVMAETEKDGSYLQSASVRTDVASNPTNLVSDPTFNAGEENDLLAVDDTDQSGQTSFSAPDGAVVTVNWQADNGTGPTCLFTGTAVAGS